MKILLLAAVLTAATSAVAAPDAPATSAPVSPAATAPAVALSPYDELVKTARAQFDAKDFAGAQKTTEQMLAIAQTPKEKSDALRRLGQTLDSQGRYAEAREIWQKMLPLIRDSPDDLSLARLVIASSYANQEMWQPAADGFAEVLKDPLVKDKSVIRLALATAYSNLKQTDKAREQLALVAADQTMEADMRGFAQFTIGKTYLDEGKFDEARQNVEAAEKIPGISREIIIGVNDTLGLIAQKQNRPADAAKAFAQERVFLMMKAIDQTNAKDLEGAIASYKAVLNTGTPELPVEPAIHLQIGNAQTKLEKYEDARVEFQKVLDAAPMRLNATETQSDNPFKIGAYLGLARIDIAEKKFDAAREKLNKALQIPNLPEKSAVLVEDLLNSLPPKP